MIDITQLEKGTGTITVEPADAVFIELGNNTYCYRDLLSELVDNAIAAREETKRCSVEVTLYVDKRNNPEKVIIKDNCKGIPKENLGLAVTPAGIRNTDSLNEHGMGMKQAIAAMGDLEYLATKTEDSPTAIVIKEFKFGDLDYFLAGYPEESGTEISIVNLKPVVNANPGFFTRIIEPYLGARYRRFLRPDNKVIDLLIYIKNEKGDILYEWDIAEVKPVYFHPQKRNNKPVIENKVYRTRLWRASLTFGYAPTEEEYKELGIDIPSKFHPYHVSLSKQGLDVILNDRVIEFHLLTELGIADTKHSDYNFLRGEISLEHGFRTAITKNAMIHDDNLTNCFDQITTFLKEGGYIKQKTYPKAIPERLLRDRLADWLKNNPVKKYKEADTEYSVEGLSGFIDIFADGVAWEIKREQATGLDVYQLFAYMDMGRIDTGYLVADSFATGATVAARFIKKHHEKEITLSKLKDFPIIHPPSEEERADYY